MSPPILVVDCYLDGTSGATNYEGRLGSHPILRWRAPFEPGLPSLDGLAGIVITGSRASVQDHEPWTLRIIALLQRAEARALPVLGVCYGHQVLAEALCGPGTVGPANRPEVGWVPIEVLAAGDPLFDGLQGGFTTFVSHGDEVRPGQERLELLARSADCAVQAFRVRELPMWGLQFHAEMPYRETVALVRRRAEQHPELGLDAEALITGAVDSEWLIERLLARWLRVVEGGRG